MDYADDYVKTIVWLALILIIPFIFFGIFVTDPGGSANSPATETSTPSPYLTDARKRNFSFPGAHQPQARRSTSIMTMTAYETRKQRVWLDGASRLAS